MSCHNQTGPLHTGCEIEYNFTVYNFIPFFIIFYLLIGALFAGMYGSISRKKFIKIAVSWPYLLVKQ